MDDSDADVENTFRILVATDTHLGYMERHGERGDDSFVSFEEVLKLSWEQNADFILLGGDLFHENKPSKNTMVKCIRLLKKYCLGDRPVPFEYVSDPSQNFSVLEPRVNYHDPNMNVAMPVFSIHGNHDDMSGLGDTAALDLLSEAGLVNYFGRCTDLQSIQISPILLQKGTARLAIYGLSNVKDDRLYRLMRSQQVSLLRPREHTDDWFSVMVLHQNRVKHSLKNYIPAEFLDSFLDVVIWGHEHENRIKPEFSESAKLHIIQPGSSVATSLCEGEARAKAVGLLEVRSGGRFQLHELPLRTVRPLVFDTLRLSDAPDFDRDALAADVDEYLTEYAEKLIVKAQEQITGHSRQPRLPLIRLRVEYPPEMPMFHPVRFGQKFLGRVANPDEMILLRKEKIERKKGHDISDGVSLIEEAIQQERDRGGRVEDFVKKHFADMDVSCGLHVLSEVGLSEAVNQFVAKGNSRAVGHILELEMKKAVSYLTEQRLLDVSEEAVRERLVQWRQQKRQQSRSASRTVIDEPSSPSLEQPKAELNPEEVEIREYLETVSRTAAPVSVRHDVSDSDDDCIMMLDDVSASSSVRGRGRGRGSRGGGRGSRGRAAATGNTTAAASRTKAASTRARGRGAKAASTTRSLGSGVQLSLDTFGMASSNGSRVSSSRSAPKKGIFFDSDDGGSG